MQRVRDLPDDAVVIQGRAEGADTVARTTALARQMWVIDVPVESPHWKRHGRSAGHKRNHLMLDLQPDLVIAFQFNGSGGTQGTIDEAERRGIPVEKHTEKSHA